MDKHQKKESAVVFFNMKEMAASGTLKDFCKTLEVFGYRGTEIVLDFRGVSEVQSDDAESLMSACRKLKGQGNTVQMKDLSIALRNLFLLTAVHSADEYPRL
ncbi:MAG: hypothetical protein JW807_07580 [Spirochaetes bacterium]|nr:hypothetical protein [Spirochaetota bacterium]